MKTLAGFMITCRLADIRLIPTDEGWLSRAGVLDLVRRKVMRWAMRNHMVQDQHSAHPSDHGGP